MRVCDLDPAKTADQPLLDVSLAVARLRASIQKEHNLGHEYGQRWAQDRATVKQLEALARSEARWHTDWDGLWKFADEEGDSYPTALFEWAEEFGDAMEKFLVSAADFTTAQEWIECKNFMMGFAGGAMGVWRAVRKQLD